MKKNFFNKNERPDFYSLLLRQCELTEQIMTDFIRFMKNRETSLEEAIDRCEREADQTRRRLIDYLEKSFITPLDRHDIYAVSRRIDDITDQVRDLKDFIVFFDFVPMETNVEMAEGIRETMCAIRDAVKAWDSGDDEDFWDSIHEAKMSGRNIKKLYWESFKRDASAEEDFVMREFVRDLNQLSYRTKKAVDRISDTKIKSIM